MAVVIETTLGDITVDLFLKERPRASLNFLKLCKMKYYNYNLFHTISHNFIAQTGDPTGTKNGGESIFGLLEGHLKRYVEGDKHPKLKHTNHMISFVGNEDGMIGSQFFITLGTDLTYLDEKHCVFGEVMEGLDVLEYINEAICDSNNRPYVDIRITHTVVLDDPYPDLPHMKIPERSPSPSIERLQGGRIAPDEEIDETEGKSAKEINELIANREAKARATILEMVGDIPDADIAPPENVLFVCKLNPVTTDDDLEIIFGRFGKVKSCEVIRDKKTGDSLQYAFVEFQDQKSCEDAYFKMDNVLIDDRRIHVDFSQSVSKIKWHGKGKGVTNYAESTRSSYIDNKNDRIYIKRTSDKGHSKKYVKPYRDQQKRKPSNDNYTHEDAKDYRRDKNEHTRDRYGIKLKEDINKSKYKISYRKNRSKSSESSSDSSSDAGNKYNAKMYDKTSDTHKRSRKTPSTSKSHTYSDRSSKRRDKKKTKQKRSRASSSDEEYKQRKSKKHKSRSKKKHSSSSD